MNNVELGKYGEKKAIDFLLTKGFIILYQNYRKKNWEIDIVAKKNKTIHFVEVKTRRSTIFGEPIEAVTKKKVINLKKAANIFLEEEKEHHECFIQFDVISIKINPLSSNHIDIEIISDVF